MTDHKPLLALFNNPPSQPTVRIERRLMNLLRYTFTVIYQPGQTNPVDYASRHPVDVATADERDDTSETEHHVTFIARNAVPKAMTLNEVEIATANDRVCKQSCCAWCLADGINHCQMSLSPNCLDTRI